MALAECYRIDVPGVSKTSLESKEILGVKLLARMSFKYWFCAQLNAFHPEQVIDITILEKLVRAKNNIYIKLNKI